MSISSLLNNAMNDATLRMMLTDAEPLRLPRVHIPRTAAEQHRVFTHELASMTEEGKEVIEKNADSLHLMAKAKDLAEGTNKAPEIMDTFKKAAKTDPRELTPKERSALFIASGANLALTPAKKEAYTKICNDVRPQKPMSWTEYAQNTYSKIKDGRPIEQEPGKGERQIYSELFKNPNALKDPDLYHVQNFDAREALTSPSKSKSDAAWERLATRFRLEPDLNPNEAILTLAQTIKTANRKGMLGSLIGK